MAFRLITKPIAYVDLDEAVKWYEKKSMGLGRRFLIKVDEARTKISERPTSFSYIRYPIRRCIVEKFPYRVLYVIFGNDIFIIAICHSKRSNAFVKRRTRLFE